MKLNNYFLPNGLMGYQWARYFIICGQANWGKTFSVSRHCIAQKLRHPDNVNNTWLRLSQDTTKKLLQNNGKNVIDPLIIQEFDLTMRAAGDYIEYGQNVQIPVKGDKVKTVFQKTGDLFRVGSLAGFYHDKGRALYDASFKGYYNIVVDEMNRAKNEKNTFDIIDALEDQIENITRNTKQRVSVFCLGNNMSETSAMFKSLNFIPREPGIYPIKKKKAVIWLLPSNSRVDASAKLNPNNPRFAVVAQDKGIHEYTGYVPQGGVIVICFGNQSTDWFTITDNMVIRGYREVEDKKLRKIALKKNSIYPFDAIHSKTITDRILANKCKYDNEVTFYKVRENVIL